MPRRPRLDAPGTLHHVMIRGIERTRIFRDDQDRENFLARIEPLVRETGTRILAWALLDNHVHLLISSGHQGLSKFMRCLLTGYAIWYNRKYDRNGHLFQNRYKSIVCEEDPYLLELVRYIHLNPLRAGKVHSRDELDCYPWSGHGVLTGNFTRAWQETDYVLRSFSDRKKKAVQIYKNFLDEGKEQGRRPDLIGGGLIRSLGGWSQVLSLRDRKEKIEYDSRILGGGDFVSEILKDADRNVRRQVRTGDREKAANELIGKICREEKISEEELRRGGQRKAVVRARGRISYELNRGSGMSMAEIGRHVGVCTSAVFKAIRKLDTA